MKKILALAAVVLGLASCQTDTVNGVKVDANGEAPVTIQVGLPEEATRAAGNNSGVGAIGNIDLDNDWDIRYILEVYDAAGNLAKERMVNRETVSTSTSFTLRLVPGRQYKFVVWADFIPQSQEGNGDYHYNTASLANVALSGDSYQHPMDESRDAYTKAVVIESFDSKSNIQMTLTRPFAKLRIVTTDMNELYSKLTYVTVDYSTQLYTAFNAIDEAVVENSLTTMRKAANYKNQDFIYADEANSKDGKMTLYADYFFGAKDNKVHFTMDVVDETDFTIPQIVFNTDIPVQRNHLTTIYGPVLTDANNVTVTIDERFEGTENWPDTDAENLAFAAMFGGEVILENDTTLAEGFQVVKSMVVNLNGKTLKYTGNDVLFRVKNGATLTINGNVDGSNIVTLPTNNGGTSAGNGYVALVSEGATLNINGGDYDAQATCTIAQVNNGTLNVYGGSFKVDMNKYTDDNGEARYLLNCSDTPYKNKEAKINVYGGSFFKFNPANNAAEGAGTNFVADGLGTVVRGDYYVVAPQVVADLDNVTEATTVEFTEDLYVASGSAISTHDATADITIDGGGQSVVSTANSAADFYWYNGGTEPAMSTVLSSANGSKVTVSNLKFEGTMTALSLGLYKSSSYNKYNTELNNVDVIGTQVYAYAAGVAPAVAVYGTAVFNYCNIYGTTLSELDTYGWPVYDVAAGNASTTIFNGGHIGSFYLWDIADLIVDNGALVEKVILKNNMYYSNITIKGNSTVNVLDLSAITVKGKIRITVEEGSTVGKVVANGVEYASIAAFREATNL